MEPYPVSGSILDERRSWSFSARLEMPVRNPACPSMDFSMSALHGQTVTQWPHGRNWTRDVEPPSQERADAGHPNWMESVSFTSTFWQASTQRPHRTHWSDRKR